MRRVRPSRASPPPEPPSTVEQSGPAGPVKRWFAARRTRFKARQTEQRRLTRIRIPTPPRLARSRRGRLQWGREGRAPGLCDQVQSSPNRARRAPLFAAPFRDAVSQQPVPRLRDSITAGTGAFARQGVFRRHARHAGSRRCESGFQVREVEASRRRDSAIQSRVRDTTEKGLREATPTATLTVRGRREPAPLQRGRRPRRDSPGCVHRICSHREGDRLRLQPAGRSKPARPGPEPQRITDSQTPSDSAHIAGTRGHRPRRGHHG
jgi:hypothetical protein